ncbi:MAG: hypothetical protein H7Z38_10035 [Rubrivivax sp.]|nr:hypothetical protein [Pyrinomonadaceae bacterium]
MTNNRRHIAALVIVLILLCCAQVVKAEPYETILNNGLPNKRVDIVIIGDAYTAAQMDKYKADARNFVNALFSQEPFREYQSYFNVHRVDVVSNTSACDDRAANTQSDTTLDCVRHSEINPAGLVVQSRLLTVDDIIAQSVLDASGSPFQQDLRVVLVNTPDYGGSESRGFAVSYVSTFSGDWEVALHEIGHAYGRLADEYFDRGVCGSTLPPDRLNVTNSLVNIPWAVWISPLTPLPTTTTARGVPGAYEGALYCPTGFYRPTYESKMRSLNKPFEQINGEL